MRASVAITMDTDWAPREIVAEAVQRARRNGVKVTLFCTNPIDVTADEIALHPNYTDIADLVSPIQTLKRAFPAARGVRSHSLFYTERLRPVYEQLGIEYDSNAMQYMTLGVQATRLAPRTLSLPLYWMDRFDLEMCPEGDDRFSAARFDLVSPGLRIFDFHPVHVVLNTPDVETYESAKVAYHDPARLRALKHDGEGIATLFDELIVRIKNEGVETWTMSQIHDANLAREEVAPSVRSF